MAKPADNFRDFWGRRSGAYFPRYPGSVRVLSRSRAIKTLPRIDACVQRVSRRSAGRTNIRHRIFSHIEKAG